MRVTEQEIADVRAALGELPAALRTRLEQSYGITPYDSDVIVNQSRPLVDYFVDLAERCGDGKLASNWVQQDVLRILKEQGIAIEKFWKDILSPERLTELLRPVKAGDIDTGRAREVLVEMISSGRSAAEVMKAQGVVKVDESSLYAIGQELIDANPKIVADIKCGKLQAAAI